MPIPSIYKPNITSDNTNSLYMLSSCIERRFLLLCHGVDSVQTCIFFSLTINSQISFSTINEKITVAFLLISAGEDTFVSIWNFAGNVQFSDDLKA